MATWLDILADNHTDAQGRFNPFSLVRGFTKSGRADLDQRRQLVDAQRSLGITQANSEASVIPAIADLRRQAASSETSSLRRKDAAIANIGGNVDVQPTDPESADVIRSLLTVPGMRQDQTIAKDTNTRANAAEGRAAREYNARAPYLPDMAKTSLAAMQEGVDASRSQRAITGEDAITRSMLVGEQMKNLRATRQRGEAVDPRLTTLLDAAQVGSQSGDPKLARALLDLASSYMGQKGDDFRASLSPQEDPQKTQARSALTDILKSEASRSGGGASQGDNPPSQGMRIQSAPQVEQAQQGFGYSGGHGSQLLDSLLNAGSKVGQAGQDVLGTGRRSLDQILEMIRQINNNREQ